MNKKDFPLLIKHPEITYLDNAATTQKPAQVIHGVSQFVENEYANIHRGLYALSEASPSLSCTERNSVACSGNV